MRFFSLKFQIIPSCVVACLLNVPIMYYFFSPLMNFNLADCASNYYYLPGLAFCLNTLSWIIPKKIKEVLVFWRLKNVLPGNRAFTLHMRNDVRIDSKKLKRKYGTLPTEPKKQNQLWYKIFKQDEEDISVKATHKYYLLFRELTIMPIVLMLFSLIFMVAKNASIFKILIMLVVLGIEYILFMTAARNAGNSLVRNVLAIASC